jgi:hypothetical protein
MTPWPSQCGTSDLPGRPVLTGTPVKKILCGYSGLHIIDTLG